MFLEKIEGDYLNLSRTSGRAGISLIGQSSAAASLRRMVQLSAATDAPLMLTGPEGVGKRDCAISIHARSDSSSAGFLSLNCATLGQNFKTVDRYSSAIGGTVYFQAIDDLPKDQYNIILQLIQARQMRIICGSRLSPAALMNENALPLDICAALSVLTLPVAPLTQRRGDIPLLFEAHVHQMPKERRFTLNAKARRMLSEYDWPGNFAEMNSIVNKLGKKYGGARINETQLMRFIASRTKVMSYEIDNNLEQEDNFLKPGFDLSRHLAEEEIKHIEQALNQSGGVVQKAAEIAGVKRTTLLAKMKKYGIMR